MSLYWSVIQMDQPLVEPDCAIAVLEQAVRLNPGWVSPQMVLAQLHPGGGPPARGRTRCSQCGALLQLLGQCLGQARAVGRLDGVGAHCASVGPAGYLAPIASDKLNNMALRQQVAGRKPSSLNLLYKK